MRHRNRLAGAVAALLVAAGTVAATGGAPAGATAATVTVNAHCTGPGPVPPTDRTAHVGVLAPDHVTPGETFSVVVSIDSPISSSIGAIGFARLPVVGADVTPSLGTTTGLISASAGASSLSGVLTLTATGAAGTSASVSLESFGQGVIVGGSGAFQTCAPAAPVELARIAIGSAAPTDPTVSVGDAAIEEGSGGPDHVLRVPVTLSSPSTAPVSVDATVSDGTAVGSRSGAPAPDYRARKSATRTVTFLPDPATGLTPTVAYVQIPVIGDTTDEGDETLHVTLSNPQGGYPVLRGTGTATILEDDRYGTNPFVSVGDAAVVEGRAGARWLKVPVTLSLPVERTVTAFVDVTGVSANCPVFTGPAPAGTDCRGRTAVPVVFAPGQTDATYAVRLYPDATPELDEQLQVAVESIQTDGPTAKPVGGVHTQGHVTLLNDD